MQFNDQQLTQIDETYIVKLVNQDIEKLANLALMLVSDLKESRERLNQNPSNSSTPSGSRSPWDKGLPGDESLLASSDTEDGKAIADDLALAPKTKGNTDESSDETNKASSENINPNKGSPKKKEKRKPGRQVGSQGFGRTQQLPVTHTQAHHCNNCQVCEASLLTIEKAYTGFYSVNITFGNTETPGLQLTNTHHLYYSAVCPDCGLKNQTAPCRAAADNESWENVGLTEWRLIGPDLAAMICYFSFELRVSRRKVKLFLQDILGLELSKGSIQNCLLESARALEPVEEQLVHDVLSESLIYVDETSHPEAGKLLWLWVFITTNTALFLVGRRTKTIFTDLIESVEKPFMGWLMSDGYAVYRSHLKRLRCWAHLERKAKGLSECFVSISREQGEQMLTILKYLMSAIYEAREGPDKGSTSILSHHQNELQRLRELCEAMAESKHKKTRELGREFLNDWDAIFRILEHPAWPLTNNEAERALRHWVILRRITQGTRSAQGSRTLALFASVIETCRLRDTSPILYIRDVIALRRRGEDAPRLPVKVALNLNK